MNTVTALKNAPQDERYSYDIFNVGDKVCVRGYTDVKPATVVEVTRGGKHVVVQMDSYKLAEGEKPEFVVGGFSGHCTNQSELKYDITRNEQGAKDKMTLRKWRGRYCWTRSGCSPDGRQEVGLGWLAFYDYNF